tara:strand:+ start:1485 stop:3245 length:1761 start_codon:yes stop_codon:yes gene_type:complete
MAKNTIILKESELIELIESTVIQLQEQPNSQEDRNNRKKVANIPGGAEMVRKCIEKTFANLDTSAYGSTIKGMLESGDAHKIQIAHNRIDSRVRYDCNRKIAKKDHSGDNIYQRMDRFERRWVRKRDRVAKLIVDMKFKEFTYCEYADCTCGKFSIGQNPMRVCTDEGFYNSFHTRGITGYENKGVNWKVNHYEEGEPGMCDNPWHCILPVLAVGALFLSGPLGWYGALGLSIGIESIDAAIYYNEGDKEMAGLVMGLAVLPLVGKVAKRFPFVKEWGKAGSKIQLKFINGEALSYLEYYQAKALQANKTWIEKEVIEHFLEISAKEQIELAGKKMTRETMEKAMEKGYLEITIDGVTRQLNKETVEGLTKAGLYTAKQQSLLIKMGKAAVPYIIAGVAYFEIYDEIAKTGLFGPKDLIEKKWGIDLDDKSEFKISEFFLKASGLEVDDDRPTTYWEALKQLFHSDSSAIDGEKMAQSVLLGWNPFELEGQGDKVIVPEQYRTEGYNEWVNKVLNNEAITRAFMSDGSEEDNNLLLLFILEHKDWDGLHEIPEEYRTETYKKDYEKYLKDEDENVEFWDNLELEEF